MKKKEAKAVTFITKPMPGTPGFDGKPFTKKKKKK